jgi:peptidoglycan/LPS O-acetylase OafA/YrhL
VARLYPLYLVLLAAQLAWAAGAQGAAASAGPEAPAFHLLTHLLLVRAWGIGDSLPTPAWSVSAELVAYGLFPLLLAPLALGGRPAVAAGLAACAAAGLVALAALPEALRPTGWMAPVGPLDLWHGSDAWPVLRCLAGFTLGLCLHRVAGDPRVARLAARPWAGAAALAAPVAGLALGAADMLVVAGFAALLLCCRVESAPTRAVLGSTAVHFAGVVSYAVYLCHWPMLPWLAPLRARLLAELGMAGGLAGAVVTLGAVRAAAAVLHRLVEAPGRAMVMAMWAGPVRSPPRPSRSVEAGR